MQALFLLITVAVLVAVLLCDFADRVLDPRTRSSGVSAPIRRPRPATATGRSPRPRGRGGAVGGGLLARGPLQPQGDWSAPSCCAFFVVLALFPGRDRAVRPGRARVYLPGLRPVRGSTGSAPPPTARTSSPS